MELDEYCWNFQDQHLKTPQQQTKHTFTSQSKHVTRNFISVGERSLLSECIVLRYRDKRPNIFRPSTRLPVRLSWHPSSAKALKSVRTSSVTDLVPLRWRRWSRILVLVGFLSSERSLPFKCITCTINFYPTGFPFTRKETSFQVYYMHYKLLPDMDGSSRLVEDCVAPYFSIGALRGWLDIAG